MNLLNLNNSQIIYSELKLTAIIENARFSLLNVAQLHLRGSILRFTILLLLLALITETYKLIRIDKKRLLKKYQRPTPEAMVESAMDHIHLLETFQFFDIKVSLKASNVMDTVQAYRLMHKKVDYPLHLGITSAGPLFSGTIKSSIGIGILLAEGIGDTIRVSLTGSALEEVKVGHEILRALRLRQSGLEIISCPTCGRTEVNILKIVKEIEKELPAFHAFYLRFGLCFSGFFSLQVCEGRKVSHSD